MILSLCSFFLHYTSFMELYNFLFYESIVEPTANLLDQHIVLDNITHTNGYLHNDLKPV